MPKVRLLFVVFTVSLIAVSPIFSQEIQYNNIKIEQFLENSSKVEVPQNVQLLLNNFYKKNNIGNGQSAKYTYLIKPIFNLQLPKKDVKNYCNFLLEKYNENEQFPLMIVKDKLQLLNNK